MWQIARDTQLALFWSRFLMAGAIFIPVFYLHFVILFLELVEKYKKLLKISYGIFIFFFFTNFTSYFVKNVEPTLIFPFWPKPGILDHPFLIIWTSIIVFVWYLLFKALKETKDTIKRQQIKYFLLGTGISFICGSTNYFLWYGILIPPYLNILVSMYVVLTTFAILKYHLFEIRVILTELLVGVMGIFQLVFSFLLPGNYKFLGLSNFSLFLIFAYYLAKATHEEERRRKEAERLAQREKALKEEVQKLAAQWLVL